MADRLRIALAKATLQVPPTYFALQHGLALRDDFDFRFFTSAGQIADPDVQDWISISDTSARVPGLAGRPYSMRERMAPLLTRLTANDIRRWSPDIVHQHFANLSGAAVRIHDKYRVPLVLTVHGADIHLLAETPDSVTGMPRMLRPHHRRTVLRALHHADEVLAVSEYLAGVAVRGGADPRKIRVHYQGIDTSLYSPLETPRADDPPTVVFIGALVKAKGVLDLLAASAALSKDAPHQLVFVGDGPLRATVDAFSAEHPHVTVLGRLSQDGVREVLGTASVLVLPTKEWNGWREAAGLVTLEAQSMEVPVVVYDSGGAREMFVDGDTGVLVEEGSIEGLTAGISQIINLSDSDRRAMGRRGRAFVQDHRSLTNSAAQLSDIYTELMR